MARPTKYTEELGDRICAELASGRPLVKICEAEDMPATSTVYEWLRKYSEFSDTYTRAREDQADYIADESIAISDNPNGDVARDRLRVETRKWFASKLKPKKYGDKIQNEVTGADGTALAPVVVYLPDNGRCNAD